MIEFVSGYSLGLPNISLCSLCSGRYYCSPNATVADAMAAYEQSYSGQSAYASRPLPHYLEKLAIDDVADGVRDVCHHLIKLYCDHTHPLHILLNTTAITDNPLDYSLRFVDPCESSSFVTYVCSMFIHVQCSQAGYSGRQECCGHRAIVTVPFRMSEIRVSTDSCVTQLDSVVSSLIHSNRQNIRVIN